jgi:hypothetical protein
MHLKIIFEFIKILGQFKPKTKMKFIHDMQFEVFYLFK